MATFGDLTLDNKHRYSHQGLLIQHEIAHALVSSYKRNTKRWFPQQPRPKNSAQRSLKPGDRPRQLGSSRLGELPDIPARCFKLDASLVRLAMARMGKFGGWPQVAMGFSKSKIQIVPPVNIRFNPQQNRLEVVVRLPQNGTIGIEMTHSYVPK